MIENRHISNLPNSKNNDYNLGEMGIPCLLTSADEGHKLATRDQNIYPSWARFMLLMRQTVAKDRRVFLIDGKPIVCCINWLRDHIHEMKAYKHWEYDLKNYLTFMAGHQHESGFFYEITACSDNFHITSICKPSLVKMLEGDGVALVRIELENDIEYLFVEGVKNVYQATGDDEWAKEMLPHMEKGINYLFECPKRYDKETGLLKRVFTIDTWDFDHIYKGLDRNIYEDSPMSIMHGDNTGTYNAMMSLAWFNRRFGNEKKAQEWEKRAAVLLENINRVCWNGNFYTHQVHLNHNGIDDLEEERLSLSNAYALNRGVFTQEQAATVIEEYLSRKDHAFAEWFSIDPPYDKFGNFERNSYINGGIASFVAGELAKGAFEHGYEAYGWDILNRLRDLIIRDRELFFLYDPITQKNQAGGPSGWSAAAIMDAIDRGLAGIVDEDVCYRKIKFAPRWAITGINEIRYITGYEASGNIVETIFRQDEDSMVLDLRTPSKEVVAHILLPVGKTADKIMVNEKKIKFEKSQIRDSVYVDFKLEGLKGERLIIYINLAESNVIDDPGNKKESNIYGEIY